MPKKRKRQELMLDKFEIQKALDESQEVKKKYPAFWKFYEMLLELNEGLMHIEQSMKEEKKDVRIKSK